MNETDAINVMLVILKVANQGAGNGDDADSKVIWRSLTNSNVLYNALFNDPLLKGYWNALIEKGLLNFDPNIGRFKTTAEGRIFLRAYEAIDHDAIKAKTRTSPSSNDENNNNSNNNQLYWIKSFTRLSHGAI